MTEPQRINPAAVIPNAAARIEPTEPYTITDADMAKTDTVLSMLRSAGLKPPFALDQAEAAQMYASKLVPFSLGILITVVQEYTDAPGAEWPDAATIATMAERNKRRAVALERGEQYRELGPCVECDDTGFIEVFGGPTTAVMACRRCRPVVNDLQRHGCFRSRHTNAGGCPKCMPAKRHGRAS